MSYREKMLQHMEQAEADDLRIQEIEAATDREVTKRYGHRIGNANSPQERANMRQFYLKRILTENPWYVKAVGNRDYHMAAATMYASAALVEDQYQRQMELDRSRKIGGHDPRLGTP